MDADLRPEELPLCLTQDFCSLASCPPFLFRLDLCCFLVTLPFRTRLVDRDLEDEPELIGLPRPTKYNVWCI